MSINGNWETRFENWKSPASETEAIQCANAERIIRKAVGNSAALAPRQTRIFAQGSLRNNTNAKQHSDVDICVVCSDTFYHNFDYVDYTPQDVGLTEPATYGYSTFKADLYQALVTQFGYDGVTMGNKAFDVHANTNRVDADVIAAFEYRQYKGKTQRSYDEGIILFTSSNERIVNWPHQHYSNGVSKNSATSRQFKAVTRILKRLRYEMIKENIASASDISSFLIECMVYNVPNKAFLPLTHQAKVRYVLSEIYNATRLATECENWVEVSDLKWLFQGQSDFKRQAAFSWASAAWDYLGFDSS